MPRRARKESSTEIYHVMTRGLNKMPVFKQYREKTRMVNLIRENLSKYEVAIYAYCIMPNHFHLLIKADLKELASFMAKILADFAKYYNFKHQRIGYVFQDRYKSQCIEKESYFWNCMRYIHLNPINENNLKNLINYTHCSIKEIYFQKPDIISEEMLEIIDKKFENMQEFLDFHQRRSWDMFEDVDEEFDENCLRIGLELLRQYEIRYSVSKREVLDYVKLREEYRGELKQILGVSNRRISVLLEKLRNNAKGTE